MPAPVSRTWRPRYTRIGRHFVDEGFYSKAGAIYKKLLKLRPDDESVQLALADISQKQGLLADAKAQLNAVAARRRNRGDKAGAAEIVVQLGSVDPADFDARTLAARTVIEMGDEEGAAARFRSLYDDLLEKGRDAEALQALREAVRLSPHDQEPRLVLARSAVLSGDFEGARAFLDRETAGDDPTLQMALLEMDLRSGELDEARELLRTLLARGAEQRDRVTELAWATAASNPDAAFVVIDALVDAAGAAGNFGDAAALLHEFAARVPESDPRAPQARRSLCGWRSRSRRCTKRRRSSPTPTSAWARPPKRASLPRIWSPGNRGSARTSSASAGR